MPPPTRPASSQQVQFIWIGFLASAVCFVAIAEYVGSAPGNQIKAIHAALIVLAFCVVSFGFLLRRKTLGASRAATDPVRAQASWALAHILSFAFAESVLLYGVVLRIALGAPRWLPPTFYLVAILLLFVWRPTDAPDERTI